MAGKKIGWIKNGPLPSGRGYHRGTARRQRFWDLCAVLFFLLLLPYACSLLFGKKTAALSEQTIPESPSGIMVSCPEEAGRRILGLEDYVAGALAASIPADCGEETLKAQAVILRTLCMAAYENREAASGELITAEAVGQERLDETELRKLWGAEYEEKWERITRAAAATKGIYMARDGSAIEPAYFWLSAGRTRDGREVLGEEYDYLISVECGHDLEAEDYSSTMSMKEDRFWEILNIPKQSTLSLTRDGAGYVLWVDAGESGLSGEKFRSLFSLKSSCFAVSCEDGNVTITCRGVGHGLGFCQYEADRRAAEGEDYQALLKDFFEGIELEKEAE